MRYIKYLERSTIDVASRDKREIAVALEMGYEVIIVVPTESRKEDEVLKSCNILVFQQKYEFMKMKFWPLRKFLTLCAVIGRMIRLASLKADVISCHDLPALKFCYLSTFFSLKKPKLIYDAHEFELGRQGKRTNKELTSVLKWERFLMKKCTFTIMVNDVIKYETIKAHRFNNDYPIVVVRSLSPRWIVSDSITTTNRKEIVKALNVEEDTFIIMYHGGITTERGIEQMLEAIHLNKNIIGVIMGYGQENYQRLLEEKITHLGITDRVLFLPPVQQKDIWQFAGAVDVGMIIAQPTCTNHLYMSPNKFFENIQSETPVICSNFPVVSKIVEEYDIGLTCDPTSPEDMNRAIEELRTNKELYNQKKENVKKAKEVLCWENEKKILINAFKKYLD